MKIFIKQISSSAWKEFREIRLKALQADPKVFASHYEKEKTNSKQDWIDWVKEKGQAIFLIYDNEIPIGMTGIFISQDTVTKTTAILWGSWLEPDYRRKGISDYMYKARIEWAKNQHELKRIVVSHRESNIASKFANQKHGFQYVREENKVWHDGLEEKEFYYELKI